MNIKEVKDLIQDILQSDISEFELEHTGTKVRIRRGFAAGETSALPMGQVSDRPPAVRSESNHPTAGFSTMTAKEEAAQEEGIHTVTSPIVGTFYRAPAPTADPYVKIGSKVEIGTILCIVEAMKLMNEIPSDVAGEIVEIHADNGHPIEFGQKLFGIRTHK
jgi:acetyl-CoA carboxylase biotin carboxyl carrier protein